MSPIRNTVRNQATSETFCSYTILFEAKKNSQQPMYSYFTCTNEYEANNLTGWTHHVIFHLDIHTI